MPASLSPVTIDRGTNDWNSVRWVKSLLSTITGELIPKTQRKVLACNSDEIRGTIPAIPCEGAVKRRTLSTAFWGVNALAVVVLVQFAYWLWLDRPQDRPLAEGTRYSPRQMQAVQDNPANRLTNEPRLGIEKQYDKRLTPPGKEKFKPNRRWKS